jgi:PadR family transcriptional regulator PadR
MSPAKRDLLPGTLDLLVLKTISSTPLHGYGIAQHIKRLSRDVLQVDEGSLYPALQRMRQRGWLTAQWGQTSNNQRARFYTITAAGRKQLGEKEIGFSELVEAIGRVLHNPARTSR